MVTQQLIADPRRTVVLVTTRSHNPRSKRWYSVAEACEFDGQLFMHRDRINSREARRGLPGYVGMANHPEAIKIARELAAESGHGLLPGLYKRGPYEELVRI